MLSLDIRTVAWYVWSNKILSNVYIIKPKLLPLKSELIFLWLLYNGRLQSALNLEAKLELDFKLPNSHPSLRHHGSYNYSFHVVVNRDCVNHIAPAILGF